jgi:hypothetical protein
VDPGGAHAPAETATGAVVPEGERVVARPGRIETVGGSGADDLPPVPWHLKLLTGAVVVYLGYRFLQGLEWLWHRLG